MNDIVMIPVGQLHHHPENPRLDLGDLTELAESIRANGVMQNLTVVRGHRMSRNEWIEAAKAEGVSKDAAAGTYNPEEAWSADGYTVVIGNRRMEASKQAGVAEVPCVISDMDHRTQVSTMLMENMQRADLTVYEQAQGFQMMMDLGYTPKEIGEKTGFSETTVNRRLKMAELDKKTFQNAVGKQISMEDLDKIGQLESVKERNALLKEFGENNFEWRLNRAIKIQRANKVRTKAHQMLQDAKVKKVPDKDKYALYSGAYEKLYQKTCELDKWDGKNNMIPKADGELFYTEDDTDIVFYLKKKKQKTEPVRKSKEELEEQKQIDLAWKTANRATETAGELRRAFAKEMKVTPKNAMEMLQWALIAAVGSMLSYNTPTGTLRKEIPLKSYDINENLDEIRNWIMNMKQSSWPDVILKFFDGDQRPELRGYADGPKGAWPKYKKNKELDLCYEWLTQFGYQMSDEEIQMMSGTHPCFQTKTEGV